MKSVMIVDARGLTVTAICLIGVLGLASRSGKAWAAADDKAATETVEMQPTTATPTPAAGSTSGRSVTRTMREWCCVKGTLEHLVQKECATAGGAYSTNLEVAKQLCAKQRASMADICCLDGRASDDFVDAKTCEEHGGRPVNIGHLMGSKTLKEDAARVCAGEPPREPGGGGHPPEPEGVCCVEGTAEFLLETTCHERGGQFFVKPKDGTRVCGGKPPAAIEGVCCIEGKAERLLETTCHERGGEFFIKPKDGARVCGGKPPAVIEGVCCIEGKAEFLLETTCRERSGEFFVKPKDGVRVCGGKRP